MKPVLTERYKPAWIMGIAGITVMIIMKVVFCIAMTNVVSEAVEGIVGLPEEFRIFRMSIGHNMVNIYEPTQSSLVARVCCMDPTLHVATSQMTSLEDARSYTKSFFLPGAHHGVAVLAAANCVSGFAELAAAREDVVPV